MQLYPATICILCKKNCKKMHNNNSKEQNNNLGICNEKQVRIRILSITFVIRKSFERTNELHLSHCRGTKTHARVCAHACQNSICFV